MRGKDNTLPSPIAGERGDDALYPHIAKRVSSSPQSVRGHPLCPIFGDAEIFFSAIAWLRLDFFLAI